jgi:hypothetical protein
MPTEHRTYPAATRAPNSPSPPPARGRWAIIVGAASMVLAVVAMIVGAALGSPTAVDQFQRVRVSDPSGTITFDNTGDYVAYYESTATAELGDQPEKVAANRVPRVPVQLTNQATGQRLVLNTPYGNRPDGKPKKLHYDYGGRGALAMWQFHISQTGRYRVELGTSPAPDADAVVAFGPSTALAAGGIAVILGALMFIAGLTTLIVGLVKHGRSKREVTYAG